MSTYLWRYYFENDVEKFRQVLANATYNTSASAAKSGHTGRGGKPGAIGSPGTSLSKSPVLVPKSKKAQYGIEGGACILTRTDVNWRDAYGITLLHYIASSAKDTAPDFASALLEAPLLDLYNQDAESGWTPLHRALYHGNVDIARMLISRDTQDAFNHGHNNIQNGAGGLIKIKDNEGKSPFDVYGASITNRIIHQSSSVSVLPGSEDDEDDEMARGVSGDGNEDESASKIIAPSCSLSGDEIFAFGSNKNFTLGFGDEDDRQYPERINLRRPEHLLRRLHAEHLNAKSNDVQTSSGSSMSTTAPLLPALVQYRSIVIQDVQLSKLHSAILTSDPEANLYMCGFGSGGRLGTGDETTRFHYVPVFGGGLMGKRVINVGLGQNHTLAISSLGEVFSWGSNVFGQLGYASASPKFPDEEPVQTLPRQVFGPLKRELVLGTATSRVHSVVFTQSSLFTFGKNDGQLGLVDSDARSLAIQNTPRKVAAALFTSAIVAVSAIDKSTVCLLDNHDVWVFANYGYTKVAFPLESFSNYFLKSSYTATRYNNAQNYIRKITSGGDTVCALSSMGDVFTVQVTQNIDTNTTSASTTNPSKIRGALSPPQRVWSMNRGQMAVTDVDVGQDGSIIICTDTGSVWRRVKRAKIKDTHTFNRASHKSKDYKFSRVPGLTSITAVRSNTFGAYAAVRRDCDVMKLQMGVDGPTLWKDLFSLLPLKDFRTPEDPSTDDPVPRFWVSASQCNDTASIRRAILTTPDLELALSPLLVNLETSESNDYDIQVGSTTTEMVFPVHEFVFAGRSETLRQALVNFRQTYFFSIPDIMSIEYDSDGKVLIQLSGVDVLTIVNLVLYIYSDTVIDVWHHTRHAPKLASRYRQVRIELMKVASALGLKKLEQAVRLMVEPPKSLNKDLANVIDHEGYFENGDVEIELDGESIRVHRAMICQRCPFFEGLFNGRAGGAWLASRTDQLQEPQERVKVDLQHIQPSIFRMVLQYLYADEDDSMFDDAVTTDFDAFLDLIMDVMAAANELMLDRLAQCCQRVLGRFVDTRNVCHLLNAVAPCSVTEFKHAALEYICLNLEGMLENNLLDELDSDLMRELDEVVRQNQLACLPFAKSGRAEAELFEAHPELHEAVERGRRATIDSLRLQSRLGDEEHYHSNAAKARTASQGDDIASPSSSKARRKSFNERGIGGVSLSQKTSAVDLIFEMDEDSSEAVNGNLSAVPLPGNQRVHSSSGLDKFPSNSTFARTAHQDREASGLGLARDAPTGPIVAISPPAAESARPLAATSVPPRPWASPALGSSKLDMREIMAQTSSPRQSSLSSGLALKGRQSDSIPSTSTAKVSQRERKRQLQQTQLDQQGTPVSTVEPEQSETREASTSSESPWRVASAGPRVSLKDVFGADNSKSSNATRNKTSRQAPTPPLTLRQTVSGNTSAIRRAASGGPSQQSAPQPIRSISTPIAPTKSAASPSTSLGNQRPAIRSVRYAPSSAEPSLQLSMADILSQQQTEKDVIKEAIAKRSLQEIQEEQAFQEWWEQESRKVQEEEEAGATQGRTVGPRGGRGGADRARSRSARGRGRGRGQGEGSSVNDSEGNPRHGPNPPARNKPLRGRGNAERGRGRGTPTTAQS